ncbi:MAG: helicase-related protein, partial [Pseudomonadota bacterium]
PRLEAMREEGIEDPFEAEQRIVCAMGLLTEDRQIADAVLGAPWDLAIIDEAHHLKWQPDRVLSEVTTDDDDEDDTPPSWHEELPHDERAYLVAEALAERSAGLLLLTATPEQLGAQSHFARLRLLDPARFSSLEDFEAEQSRYRTINDHIEPLLTSARALSDAERAALTDALGHDVPENPDDDARRALLHDLLDRHGTGRVLFRNTRRAIPDFPTREVHPVALDAPAGAPATTVEEALYGPADAPPDWRSDPRVEWLVAFLKADRSRKVLVICHHMEHARTLDEYLTLREGLRSTSFYEGLSLLERDRAAAYFAQDASDGGGAQVLVCSEIGSEGRNFQFAQHLVLFDLPRHVDLLEQRIGRLDRIGQRDTIHIHVPHMTGTATHALFRWYHEGLDALAHSVAGAAQIHGEFRDELEALLVQPEPVGAALDDLVGRTAERTATVVETMAHGRDRLIELNSCHPERAAELVEQLHTEDEDRTLASFLGAAFDHFGIEQ